MSSLYTVSEVEQAIITQFGKPVGDPATTAGLKHLKATFLIDREGILRWRKTGPIAPGDTSLSAAIERALGS